MISCQAAKKPEPGNRVTLFPDPAKKFRDRLDSIPCKATGKFPVPIRREFAHKAPFYLTIFCRDVRQPSSDPNEFPVYCVLAGNLRSEVRSPSSSGESCKPLVPHQRQRRGAARKRLV
jgi:hypothetical protein